MVTNSRIAKCCRMRISLSTSTAGMPRYVPVKVPITAGRSGNATNTVMVPWAHPSVHDDISSHQSTDLVLIGCGHN